MLKVYVRGDYVEFAVPHCDAGGERYCVCHNGRSKVQVNQVWTNPSAS